MATDLLSLKDLSDAEVDYLVRKADDHRLGKAAAGGLTGKTVALLFEKPSLRTKVSFHMAVHELGGHAVFLGRDELDLDCREPVEDLAKVLDRYVAAIVARVKTHSMLDRMAEAVSVPVINALSDREHPCQAIGDLLTIRQHQGDLHKATVAYVGDANNVALSLALACGAVGASFRLAAPEGYGFSPQDQKAIQERFAAHGSGVLEVSGDPNRAVQDANVVYTDAWTSMGQEAEAEQRRKSFAGFQVNDKLLARARLQALFMHPMPAHYGEEVPPGMLDHAQSVAYDQAENRLHAQKAVLEHLLSPD
jgi:ornithine carbamoyltransferase